MAQDDINGLKGIRVDIPAGATNAYLVVPINGECSTLLKNFAGGSFELVEAPSPASGYTIWAGASLVALLGTGYPVGANEVVSIGGAARYYVMAAGATTTLVMLKGRTSGY